MYVRKINLRFFKISGKYANVLFRLDLHDFAKLLIDLGYSITASLPPRTFKGIVGGKISIAHKLPGFLVEVNTESHIIGISSPQPELALQEFKLIEDSLKEKLFLELKPHYYEVLVEAEIEGKYSPIDTIRKIGSKINIINKLNESIGLDINLYSIKISKPQGTPDATEWYDLEIYPSPIRPTKFYYIAIVYRKPTIAEITDFVNKLNTILVNTITTLENHNK